MVDKIPMQLINLIHETFIGQIENNKKYIFHAKTKIQ